MSFIIKHSQDVNPQKVNKENKDLKGKVMNNTKKIEMAESIINDMPQDKVKRIKKDKSLIERTESSKIILTDDNKQLLAD